MATLDCKKFGPVSEVIFALSNESGHRINLQPIVDARLVRRGARSEVDQIVADRHQIGIRVRRFVGYLVFH
jgi:hypothetical protein